MDVLYATYELYICIGKIDRIRSFGGEKIMVITIKKKKKEEEKIMVIDDPVYIIADPVKIK